MSYTATCLLNFGILLDVDFLVTVLLEHDG